MSWFYIKTGMLEDETVGPLADRAMIDLFLAKKITGKTVVSHATHTSGQWVALASSPLNTPCMTAARERKKQAEDQQAAERAQRDAEKQAEREQREEERRQQQQEREIREVALQRAVAVAEGQKREGDARVGVDRWPNMFRCASVYELVAVILASLFAVLACAAGIWPILIGLGSFATGEPIAILFGADRTSCRTEPSSSGNTRRSIRTSRRFMRIR